MGKSFASTKDQTWGIPPFRYANFSAKSLVICGVPMNKKVGIKVGQNFANIRRAFSYVIATVL